MHAVPVLLNAHFAARLRRVGKSFSSPRRVMLSVFVLLLALVWVGQTLASMFLREPFDPHVFRRWVSLPLMMYFFWHVIRVAWQRPEEAIEWSPEEESLVVGGPFSRVEILAYRFAVIFTATLPKAVLTSLVLWPDLSWIGPLAMLLALVFLELFRLIMDLATNCLTKRSYSVYRICVLTVVGVVVFVGYQRGMALLDTTGIAQSVQIPIAQQGVLVAQSIRHSPAVAFLETPFLMVADVVSGNGLVWLLAVKLLGMCLVVVCASVIILKLDALHTKIVDQHSRKLWGKRKNDSATTVSRISEYLPRIPLAGFGGHLIWRQCKRASRYAGSLLVSMGIPAMLACLPLFAVPNSEVAFVAVVCGVLFYTFVLLPEAIKFDFRLDSDHMCLLKSLPMTSTRLVVGQLVTPILLACCFQTLVILFAGLFRGVSPWLMTGAIAITLPLTVIFVALDNLVFLLYPHRPTQEGFEAFLRTILKFTGKSLLMVIAGGVLVLWAPVASHIAARTSAINTATVFYTGLSIGIAIAAVISVQLVVGAFDRFDVSIDVVS